MLPMLAQSSKTIASDVEVARAKLERSGGWLWELKWDGVRMLAEVRDGQVYLNGRRGADATYRYPDLVAALTRAFPAGHVLLDGEVIVLGEDGRPSIDRALRRDAQRTRSSAARFVSALPARYVAFDLLQHDGRDLTREALQARTHELARVAASWQQPLMYCPPAVSGTELWEMVRAQRLEGLMAKRATSPYVSGRSSSWVKIKATRVLHALVCGYDPGEGHRASTFGALHLCLLDETGDLTPIGRVGSGFSELDLRQVRRRLSQQQPIVVEVEYQEVSPNGQLRFPVFRGLADDVELTACTTGQIHP